MSLNINKLSMLFKNENEHNWRSEITAIDST